jgi:hypothetical protein
VWHVSFDDGHVDSYFLSRRRVVSWLSHCIRNPSQVTLMTAASVASFTPVIAEITHTGIYAPSPVDTTGKLHQPVH